MMSNFSRNDDVSGPYGNSSGSFAPLDTAFSLSPHMSEFQDRITHGAPLTSRKINVCDIISTQSEEKINNNIDDIAGAIYDRNHVNTKMAHTVPTGHVYPTAPTGHVYPTAPTGHVYPTAPAGHVYPTAPAGHVSPTNKQYIYPLNNSGSEQLENFNLQQGTQNLLNEANQTAYNVSGMSFWKLLLLVILLVIFIYAVYCLITGNGGIDKKITDINIVSARPKSIILSETFRKFFV